MFVNAFSSDLHAGDTNMLRRQEHNYDLRLVASGVQSEHILIPQIRST